MKTVPSLLLHAMHRRWMSSLSGTTSIAAEFKPGSTGKAAIAANDFEQLISVLNFLNQLRVF